MKITKANYRNFSLSAGNFTAQFCSAHTDRVMVFKHCSHTERTILIGEALDGKLLNLAFNGNPAECSQYTIDDLANIAQVIGDAAQLGIDPSAWPLLDSKVSKRSF